MPSELKDITRSLEDDLMSPTEVAGLLGVSVKTLSNWRSQRRGPEYFRAGRTVWYSRRLIENWIAQGFADSLQHPVAGRTLLFFPGHR